MSKPTDAELENRFTYQSCDVEASYRIRRVSDLLLATAIEVRNLVPEGRELSQALTDLGNARMHANQGIACNQDKL